MGIIRADLGARKIKDDWDGLSVSKGVGNPMAADMRPIRAQAQNYELDYERLDREDVRLSAWAMNLVSAAGMILRELPD